MKTKTIKLSGLILAFVVLVAMLGAFALTVSAAETSGTTGDCTWIFNDVTGILTISGDGEMANYQFVGQRPWHSHKEQIANIVIESGVTTVGNLAFNGCSNLIEVELPDTLTKIGARAFYATGLSTVPIPASVTAIDSNAFYGCTGLTYVEYWGTTAPTIGSSAFYGYEYTVYVPTTYEGDSFGEMPISKTLVVSTAECTHEGLAHVEAKESSCYEDGNVEYWYCEACDRYWLDEACTIDTTASEVVISAEHVYSGCLDIECDICGDDRGAIGHRLIYKEESQPDNCLEIGYIAHWACLDCGRCFEDEEGYYGVDSEWIEYRGNCVRPEGVADCLTVPCELCGEDVVGYGEHVSVDPECKDRTCSKCDQTIEGYGCANYDTPACEDGICYYCGGFVAGFGHENGAWSDCTDGECAYGCGLKYPAATEHIDEDVDDYCDTCWSHLSHIFEDNFFDPCLGGYCDVCWTYVDGAHSANNYDYCEVCQVKITGASISAGVDLTIKYYVVVYDEYIIEEEYSFAMTFTMNGKSVTVLANEELVDGEYVFEFNGITPQCMADLIDAALVAVDENGEVAMIFAEKKGYSLKQNLSNLLADNAEDEILVQLITDMLTYGAAAQEYTGYNTDALVNVDVEGMAAPSARVPENTDKAVTTHVDTLGEARFEAATVWFDNVNKIGVKLSATENVRLFIDNVEITLGEGPYYYTDAIGATEFDKVFTFTLYEGETHIQTLTYSVSSYVHSMQNSENVKMAALAKALYNYGMSAMEYQSTQIH